MKHFLRLFTIFFLCSFSGSLYSQQSVTVISRCGGVDTVFIPTIVDYDHDGMDDVLEQKLIEFFCPIFIQYDDESCPGPALNGTGDSNLIVHHIFPYPQQYTRSSSFDSILINPIPLIPKHGLYAGLIWYPTIIKVNAALLYGKDCGLLGHTADIEGFNYSLKYIGADSAAGWMYDTVLAHWKAVTIQTISHEGTPCEQIETNAAKKTPPFLRNDTVLCSPDKHGNYLTKSKCGSSIICNPGCGGVPSHKYVKPINVGELNNPLITDLGTVYAAYAGNSPWGTTDFLSSQGGNAGAIQDKMLLNLTADFAQGSTLTQPQICPLYTNCFGTSGSSSSAEICFGDSFMFHNQSLFTSGIYTHTLTNQYSCDSIIQFNLIVNQNALINQNATICSGDSFTFHQHVLRSSGVYYDTLNSIKGCDSVIQLQLTVSNAIHYPQYQRICEGDSFYFKNNFIKNAGVYLDSLQAVATSCDSVVELHLNVNPLPLVTWQNGKDTFLIGEDSLRLTAGIPTGGVYSGNGVVGDYFYPSIAGLGNHLIVYRYSDSLGCNQYVTKIFTVIQPNAIVESTLGSLIVYPIPVQNNLFIQNGETFQTMNISSIDGKKWLESKFSSITNVSYLAKGIYILKLFGEQSVISKIIIKE